MSLSMQLNRCPVCGEIAITRKERLTSMKKSFSCLHCRSNLRLHSLSTGTAFGLTGLAVLLSYSYYGLNSSTLLFAIACLSVFCTVLLLIPLQAITNDSES